MQHGHTGQAGATAEALLTTLQTSGGAGHEAALFWMCVGGFLPQPAISDRPESPRMYRICAHHAPPPRQHHTPRDGSATLNTTMSRGGLGGASRSMRERSLLRSSVMQEGGQAVGARSQPASAVTCERAKQVYRSALAWGMYAERVWP